MNRTTSLFVILASATCAVAQGDLQPRTALDGLFREGFGLDDDHLTRFRTALIATSD